MSEREREKKTVNFIFVKQANCARRVRSADCAALALEHSATTKNN
jgi:hypothetical protein